MELIIKTTLRCRLQINLSKTIWNEKICLLFSISIFGTNINFKIICWERILVQFRTNLRRIQDEFGTNSGRIWNEFIQTRTNLKKIIIKRKLIYDDRISTCTPDASVVAKCKNSYVYICLFYGQKTCSKSSK